MSIMNFLAQIMSGNVQVDPETKAILSNAMSGTEAPSAGGGRGFVNPPQGYTAPQGPGAGRMVGTQAPVPSTPMQSAMQFPGNTTDNIDAGGGQNFAMQGSTTPMQAAMQPMSYAPDNRDVGGSQNFAMQGPAAPERGFIDKFFNNVDQNGNSAFMHAMRGLGAAGSADPLKTMMLYGQQDSENEKIRQAKRKASQGETKYLGNGAFAEYAADGKLLRTFVDATAAKVEEDARDGKFTNDVKKQVLINQLGQGRDQAKVESKAAEDASPLLRQAQEQLASIQLARETLPRMGTMDQVKGMAGSVGDAAASFVNPQMNIDSQKRNAVRVLDWVRSSEPLKGALSNVEGLKLDAPLPKAGAAPEEWAAYFDNSERVLRAAEAYLQKKVERGGSAAAPATAASPPPSDQLKAAVTASGIPFEPEKFQYRIGPNGQVQRKAK